MIHGGYGRNWPQDGSSYNAREATAQGNTGNWGNGSDVINYPDVPCCIAISSYGCTTTNPSPLNIIWKLSPEPRPKKVFSDTSVLNSGVSVPDHAIVALGSVNTGLPGVTRSVIGS